MVVPRFDPAQPEAPVPDNVFIDAVCAYLDPRRLVTTEVFVRGPIYRSVLVSVGLRVVSGQSTAVVVDRVKRALRAFLSPLPPAMRDPASQVDVPPARPGMEDGWPLRKSVVALELQAVASQVDGVLQVEPVLVAVGDGDPQAEVPFTGLELPRLAGISVVAGPPRSLDDLRGAPTPAAPGRNVVPVPAIPEEC
jgi:hypothetical protein